MKHPKALAALSATTLIALSAPAVAWDEDTCATYDPATATTGDAGVIVTTDDAGVSTVRDPYCANPQPLLGSNSTIAWDHSTAHWEYTYAVARCVGLADAEAQRLAAADEATDMSSPACGSTDANVSGDQYYREGYACGYEIGARGDAGASAITPYPAMLRWSQTDRCRRTTATRTSLLGHSEFFHYPYWTTTATDGTQLAALERLSGWASGVRAHLFDPAGSSSSPPCDMANPTPAGAVACTTPTVSSYAEYNNSRRSVCRSSTGSPNPNDGWRMPQSTVEGDERAFRTGIYLHSLGDSYSHFTCQWFSGQSVNTSTYRVTVPVDASGASAGATDHTSYGSAMFAYRCDRMNLPMITLPDGSAHQVTTEECNAACDLGAHDREFGSYDTAKLSTSAALQSLRNVSITGLTAVWTALATHAGRTSRDDMPRYQATAYRANIPRYFNGYYDGAARQAYVRNLMASDRVQPCTCPHGVYDWVPSGVDATGARTGGYCESIDTLRFSTDAAGMTPVTSLTLAAGQSVRLYAVGGFTRTGAQTGTATRVISDIVDWSATGAATVNNTTGSSIGTVTAGATAGAATIEVRRLGVTGRITVTVN